MQRPQFIGSAIQLIWLTLGLDALTMVANYDGTAANLDSLTFNGTMLIFYAFVTIKTAVGRNWARHSYAFLVAMEFALVAAFGLSDATELEVLLTYLTLPLELWILYRLFSAEADVWFRAQSKK